MRDACDGTDRLAERLHVGPHAVQGYALKGRKPSAPVARLIGLLCEELGVPNPLFAYKCTECKDLGLRDPTPKETARYAARGMQAPLKFVCERCVDVAYKNAGGQ